MPRAVGVRRSRYGVRLGVIGRAERTYRGVVYDSKAEMRYAQHLDYLKLGGRIADWESKLVPLPLVAGLKYTPDFQVIALDGSRHYVEVKGIESEGWIMRKKLFKHCYPGERLVIVKRGVEREA